MTELNIPRVVIAATQSGSGKTTIVTGLLAALRQRGLKSQPYKIGPDYIDPGYHELAAGIKGHNLDTWLVPKEKIQSIFCQSAKDSDIAVVEGVMGLYDGGKNGISSTASLAKLLKAPVILVIDVKSMGDSAAAIALGFKQYDPDVWLAGVILNRVGSKNHQEMIESALKKIGIEVLGVVFRDEGLHMPERHLGLVPTQENDSALFIDRIGKVMMKQLAIEKIEKIAQMAPKLLLDEMKMPRVQAHKRVTIAVAKDEAFSFYYPASLAVLEQLGANIVYFSPLEDKELPIADGIILGGGFPEVFAQRLENNTEFRKSLKKAAERKIPIYAECGGFMYLTEYLIDFSGQKYEMAGVIPCGCRMNNKLQTVGYVEAAMKQDTLLGKAGTILRGHEFHFSSQDKSNAKDFSWAFTFKKNRNQEIYDGGFFQENLLASYLHLHFAGNVEAAKCFIEACKKNRERLV